MRRIGSVLLLAVALCLPGMASAQAEDASKAKAKKVCRATTNTSSRIARANFCMPQEEWDRYDAKAAAGARGLIDGVNRDAALQPTVEMTDTSKQQPGPGS